MTEKRINEIVDIVITRHNKPIEVELGHIHKTLVAIDAKIEKQNGRVFKCENKLTKIELDLITHVLKDPNNERIGALEDNDKADRAIKGYIRSSVMATSAMVALITTIVATVLSYLLYLRAE